MQKPSRAEYTPLDFAQWKAGNSLSLTPKFQRRGVWKSAARSFFVDSLLKEMPVPPIYIRQTQSQERDRVLREVVDGQQRIAAVLEFMEGKYRLAKTLQDSWKGKDFNGLSADEQDRITTYPFSVQIFAGISDLDVLEIFSRLNTYSVSLNNQELRNGRFFGLFKQSVYAMAHEHLEFWRRLRIFTERSIARMLIEEFVSEVFVAFLDGMQDKKKSLNDFYELYDESFAKQDTMKKRFREVVDEINGSIGEDLKATVFRRPPILYSLFCVIYHRRHGLPKADLATTKTSLSKDDRTSLRDAVQLLSEQVETAASGEDIPRKYTAFVAACQQQTDNIKPREIRFKELYRAAFG
jgi:hypothetical protein